jgi:hypothetical protein
MAKKHHKHIDYSELQKMVEVKMKIKIRKTYLILVRRSLSTLVALIDPLSCPHRSATFSRSLSD